jgi:hypothetical protein
MNNQIAAFGEKISFQMKDIFSASQNVYEFGLRALAFPVRLQL